jgi:hypothetical protein
MVRLVSYGPLGLQSLTYKGEVTHEAKLGDKVTIVEKSRSKWTKLGDKVNT